MFLSLFDIFKVGVGPSSSHTMGPMSAAYQFMNILRSGNGGKFNPSDVVRLEASLHGSLAFTGKGHATDRAVTLGLAGFQPHTLDPDMAEQSDLDIRANKKIMLFETQWVTFNPETDLFFDYEKILPLHTNGLNLCAFGANDMLIFEETYYSIGGGFILTEAELTATKQKNTPNSSFEKVYSTYPYPFDSAKKMLEMGEKSGLSIADMKRVNEESVLGKHEFDKKLEAIWQAMDACIERGLNKDGILPGGLFVKRRAKSIRLGLERQQKANTVQPHAINDWLSVYAMAVNEENANGGRVVTSPTNGAAGVVPAVIRYYKNHCIGANDKGLKDFLITAAAIGGLIKHNASISGAECGCQAEIGSASAMAAAGLCAALGGTNQQIENAAEIALEHHLGMTCDPVNGLVQVPCIERNAIGSIKAVSAASLALHGDGEHFMPLDNFIETMRQTGLDMREKYKETSLGGLAVNLPEC